MYFADTGMRVGKAYQAEIPSMLPSQGEFELVFSKIEFMKIFRLCLTSAHWTDHSSYYPKVLLHRHIHIRTGV